MIRLDGRLPARARRIRAIGRMGGGRRGRGQILLLFALALVALIGMVGLVLDVGGAFAQRQREQSATDLAALSGADYYLVTGDATAAAAEARTIATANGYTDGAAGVRVTITVRPAPNAEVTVVINAPHANSFSSVLGQPSWSIDASASASGAIPDTAIDPAPFVFSGDLFGTDGNPKAAYTLAGCGGAGCAWPEAGGLVPSGSRFAWTDFAGTPAVNSSIVGGLIDGSHSLTRTLSTGSAVSERNSGDSALVFTSIAAHMTGGVYPVAVVSSGTNRFLGWASFMVTGASGSSKQLTGYFLGSYQSASLSASGTCAGECPHYLGSFFLGLTN